MLETFEPRKLKDPNPVPVSEFYNFLKTLIEELTDTLKLICQILLTLSRNLTMNLVMLK